jgi:1,4-alpha-glucan branching enzyme
LLRGTHPLDRGLLFHLFQPAASSVQLFGTFSGWTGTSMEKDNSGLWWSVVPNIEPGSTLLFKFRIEHPDGRVEWGRGVNPINRDPYGNARRWVTGTETLFSRELARAKLSEISGGK